MDAPNLEPRGLHWLNQNRLDRPFSEDDASMSVKDDASTSIEDDASTSVEDDASTSVEDDASTSVGPSITRRIFRASAVFSFLVLVGAGSAFAWRSYHPRDWVSAPPTDMVAPPLVDAAEIQRQLKSISTDLAAVKQTLEQQSAANNDQLTRIKEQISQQSSALQAAKQELSQILSSSPPANKPARVPPPKPVQHSAQTSPNPARVPPPQSLTPPNQ